MKNTLKLKVALLCYCVNIGAVLMAQDAESIRAKNYLELSQLLALQAKAPYYLTTADLARIIILKGVTPTDICKNVKVGCSSVILPVTDLTLKGQRINNEKVKLDWETKAEYNNKGFVLERQSFYNNLVFDSLVFINGAGTSYSKNDYSYIDLNNYRGNSFYRIKQIDFDGKFTYSNTVVVEGYTGAFEVNVVPNPVTTNNVRFYFKGLDVNEAINLTISNAVGVQILKKTDFIPANGYYELQSQMLSKGYYFITVYQNGGIYTKPFSVIR